MFEAGTRSIDDDALYNVNNFDNNNHCIFIQ